jgi:hypothetical protein
MKLNSNNDENKIENNNNTYKSILIRNGIEMSFNLLVSEYSEPIISLSNNSNFKIVRLQILIKNKLQCLDSNL